MRWPLMTENISRGDIDALIAFLAQDGQKLTQGPQVAAFEREFADWVGTRHAVFVNSGASANLITIAALGKDEDKGEVIVPAITWSSDIASVIHAGLTPVLVDVDPRTLGMGWNDVLSRVNVKTRAVFLTHVLGFDGLDQGAREALLEINIPLIEDCCESIGAMRGGRRLGSFGVASNFSFYYGHHMTTIEGGMVCTNDDYFYEQCRMLRSHGMTREIESGSIRDFHERLHTDTHPEFTFEMPAFNVRSTELNAVLGRRQLRRIDDNIAARTENLSLFLGGLDGSKYWTDYAVKGSSNFALPLILREPDTDLMAKVVSLLGALGIEFRRGTAGGGNQARQPYLRKRGFVASDFPIAEHIHKFGLYVGNYPSLDHGMISDLCDRLNTL